MGATGIKIAGTGHYLPEKILSNKELETMVDTSDEWIQRMTGIRQRHIADPQENTSDLCYKAAKKAIEDANLSSTDVDMIVLGTSTPDTLFPATACSVQKALRCRADIPVFDFEIACSSYLYGMIIASQFIRSGMYKNVLVVTGDIMSRIVNYKDRSTCILFGDGASAVVLSASEKDHLLGFDWGSNPYEPMEFLYVRGGGIREWPKSPDVPDYPHIIMDGPEIYRLAVKKMSESIQKAIENAKLQPGDIDFVIPHQANIRIMSSVVKYLDLSPEKLINTIGEHGNTSGATVGIALDIARKQNIVKDGNILGLTAFGAGLAWGSVVVKL